ncbi:MAG: S9 family peptidase [Hyphomonadaceae bacterium]|nr:S9 family peptidase [Hyphomonadaceae bacterium]
MRYAFVGLAALLAAMSPALAQDAIQRTTRGALTLEQVPETPAPVRARLQQYVNARAASFQDWAPGGGVLIATRFGDTAQIHHVAQPLGARMQLTFFEEPVAGAEALPGGGIVFTRDVGGNENFGGYLLDEARGRTHEFTEQGTRNLSFTISDDGARVAWARTYADRGDYDIFLADPREPASRRRILQGTGAIAPIDWSADGRLLLLGQTISIAKSRRFILDVATGALQELTPDLDVAYAGGEFSPDGRALYLLSDEGSDHVRLVRLDRETGARTPLSPETAWSVESFDLSPDGRKIAYVVNEAGNSTLRLIDARTGRALPAPALPAGVISGVTFCDESARIGFTLNGATSPGDVYTYELRARRLTRWTQSEVGGLNPETFVAPRLIEWTSFDGLRITGFLYAPRTPGPHPVVISIHGGPEAQFRPTFSSTIQYLVNELGIAVIAPNVRGSDGYGKAFLALDNAERREDSVRDIGALLDWIAEQDDLDAARTVVYGGSYGGYMVLASMTHYNDRLAGAVNIVGISNFVTFLENTSGYRRDLRRVEYGDERDPAMRETLLRISPLTNAARITKPLFVIHGANDPRVPVSEAEQLLRTVRANGGDAWYMLAANEGHGFRRRENQQAQREAETLFFQRVLGVAPRD